MVLIPLLSHLARPLSAKIEKPRAELHPDLAFVPRGVKNHAIVVGHGRVGQILCDMLERHRFPFITVDNDPAVVSECRRGGREIFYGDATIAVFLKNCGLMEAKAVVATMGSQAAIDKIVGLVRAIRPDILIVSRARDAAHGSHLYEIGVTDAVPETIEASVQLSEATLVGLGLGTGPVIASIQADDPRRPQPMHLAVVGDGRPGGSGRRTASGRFGGRRSSTVSVAPPCQRICDRISFGSAPLTTVISLISNLSMRSNDINTPVEGGLEDAQPAPKHLLFVGLSRGRACRR
jgi:voltage-gated potassium channel Kch